MSVCIVAFDVVDARASLYGPYTFSVYSSPSYPRLFGSHLYTRDHISSPFTRLYENIAYFLVAIHTVTGILLINANMTILEVL